MTLDATEAPTPDDEAAAARGGTFPAGAAVAMLIYGFLFTRLFVGLTVQRPWLAVGGTFCAVLGVCLALLAMPKLAWEATVGQSRTPLSGASMMLRSLGLAPVAVACVCAMGGDIPHAVQWAALLGLLVTVQVSLLRAVWIALRGRMLLPALTLWLLALGEAIELLGPAARAASVPGSAWPALAEWLSPVGEGIALLGVPLAFAWALRSSLKGVGPMVVAAFGSAPAAMLVVLATLASRYPRTTEQVARVAFSARFALVRSTLAGGAPRWFLALYTLLFTGLIATAGVSLAGQRGDRGASIRRAFGWPCVLMAGFGGASPAGAIDPFRAAALALGVLLLEQAMAREEAT